MFKTSLRLSLNPWIKSYCFYDWSPSILVTSPEAQESPRRDLTFKNRKLYCSVALASPQHHQPPSSHCDVPYSTISVHFISFSFMFLFQYKASSFHGNKSSVYFQKRFGIFYDKLVILWKERLMKRLNAIYSISGV